MKNQTPRQLIVKLHDVERWIRLCNLDREFKFAHLSKEQLEWIPKSCDHIKLEIERDAIRVKLAELHDNS
jgi:hypothetical protein